ncbi:MAG: hypothetical protein ACM3XZ_00120 [Betaproteobacteria bacterium]
MLAATLFAAGGGRKPVSDVEVVRRAKALGMIFPGEGRLTLGAAEKAKSTEEKPPGEPSSVREPPASPGASSPARSPQASATRGPSMVTVVVPPGATAAEVARLLRAKSLIADETEFLRKAAARQAETRFLPGTYRFPSNVAVKDMISSLLRGPSTR